MSYQLEVQDLSIFRKDKPKTPLVSDLSFSLHKGKTLAIVGESGSGKTLTALSITGLLPSGLAARGQIRFSKPEGEVNLAGWGLADRRWRSLRGKDLGMVFQEPMTALNPVRTLGRQLMESIAVHQPRHLARDLALSWMEKVQLPDPERFFHRYPHQVSGGQKQRLMIAMAMCHRPRLLIADEPTTALDVTIQKEVVILMRSLADELNTAILFITHDLGLAADMADEVLLMYRGKALAMGSVDQLLVRGEHPYARKLLDCRPGPEKKGRPLLGENKELASFSYPLRGEGPSAAQSPLIQIRDLDIEYRSSPRGIRRSRDIVKAVDRLSLDIYPGEILGLVGESGSGKSSIGRAILGMTRNHRGRILYRGMDISTWTARQWKPLRSRIQMVFQDPYSSLNPRRSVRQTLEEALILHGRFASPQREKEMIRLLDEVGLPSSALGRYPHEFSGGQRQRLAIARALATRPDLLICDEAVSALDLLIQAQILNLLQRLRAEKKLTMLFISHDLSVVQYISDRVLVLYQGKRVEEQEARDLFAQPRQEYTRRLIASMPGHRIPGGGPL